MLYAEQNAKNSIAINVNGESPRRPSTVRQVGSSEWKKSDVVGGLMGRECFLEKALVETMSRGEPGVSSPALTFFT